MSLPAPSATAISEWLLAEAAHLPDMGVLVDALAHRLLDADVPVARVASMVETLHPRFVGAMRVWEPGSDMRLRRVTFDDPVIVAPDRKYTIDELQKTGRPFEIRLDDPAVDEYDLLPDLRAAGHTHYVLMPLRFRGDPLHGVSYSTKRPGGFSPEHRAVLDAILPALNAVMNVQSVHRMWGDVLRAYVGTEPAELILKGAIRRGDVRRIRAAMMMSDLRGFTVLANASDPETTVAAINAYLDRVVPQVVAAGGEVLKFMGDGVLAIFPVGDTRDERAACGAALAAANAALAAGKPGGPRLGMALHVGEAAYGNIGAGDRLDFTVIGRDVNLLARLEKLCGVTGEPLVMSAPFARCLDRNARELGTFDLKGFAAPQPAFAPAAR
ncbi:MAG: adenylate/guanylate cyclase domain-containing protein [Alphaproteobacteria bacterium]|nr:adenylate/guanylate cyclase domain-containing protein [Alphaproteobacteria bacterium]